MNGNVKARAIASCLDSPVLAGLFLAIGSFAKDLDTLIEQSLCYSNSTVNATPPSYLQFQPELFFNLFSDS